MKTAALIVTTGLPGVSGVAALMPEVGSISAGQRMISAFQCAGVTLIGLVTGPENKKAERAFAQNGVVFLRCKEETTGFFQGVKQGLSFLSGKYDRVFVVPGDTPLFLPQTLSVLQQCNANIVIPENKHVSGFPVLLDQKAMDWLLEKEDFASVQKTMDASGLWVETICVEDSGILLRGRDMSHRKLLIQNHNNQLARPVTEVTLCSGGPLYDPRLSMLLHLVEDTHSVRDACSLMQMSYSTAWNMLNRVEDQLGYPLVVRIRGGSKGSGSVLTEKGKRLMVAYDRFSEDLNREAWELYSKIFEPLSE